MAVMSYTRVNKDEEATIRNYLRSGMPKKQITELTGRTYPTIKKIQDKMEIDSLAKEVTKNTVDNFNAQQPTIANSDYAKAKLSGDQRWENSSLSVEKCMTINSKKTGFTYKASKASEYIEVCVDGEVAFTIPKIKMEAFADELIDVVIELSNF